MFILFQIVYTLYCAFIFHLCYHKTHNTQQKQLTAFSIHRLLTFVNAVNEDIVVGRFRVPAAGANTTNKTAQGGNWFSRNHHAGYFLELHGEKATIVLKAPGSHSLSL